MLLLICMKYNKYCKIFIKYLLFGHTFLKNTNIKDILLNEFISKYTNNEIASCSSSVI